MFKDYQNNPVITSAHKIVAEDSIVKVEGIASTYSLATSDGEHVIFKAYLSTDAKVEIGDYIVYLKPGTIHHQAKFKFEDGHIIPGAI